LALTGVKNLKIQLEIFINLQLLEIKIIQGLVSLEVKSDHVYMHLVENAPFNKGQTKVYAGVAGNLVAYACKLSFNVDTMEMFSFEITIS
jgi:hypothetical protein